MNRKEGIMNIISSILWCGLLSFSVFIDNVALRYLCLFFGIAFIISILEFILKITGNDGPFYTQLRMCISVSDKKQKTISILKLMLVPIIMTLAISLMFLITDLFFKMIGLY